MTLLPELPTNLIPSELMNNSALEKRKDGLNQFLEMISQRQDILSCDYFKIWFVFDPHDITTSPASLEITQVVRINEACMDHTYSSAVFIPSKELLLATNENVTNTSNFGKMWTIMDDLELGGHTIFRKKKRESTGDKIFMEDESHFGERRLTALVYNEDLEGVFIGRDDGVLTKNFLTLNPEDDRYFLEYNGECKLGTERVVKVTTFKSYLLVVLVNSIRIVDPINLSTVAGGSLRQRLNDGFLSSVEVSTDLGRIFLSSTKGNIFIYKFHQQALKFEKVVIIQSGRKIESIHASGSNFFVGVGSEVYVLSGMLNRALNSEKVTAMFAFDPKLESFTFTPSVSSLKFLSDFGVLAAGYSNGLVALWDTKTGNLAAALRGHETQVSTIEYFPEHNLLHTAGDSIKFWKLCHNPGIKN
eukprot:CAMPEP_0114982630 /NCGR_PEP_ID=MMETSP0216-20121206/6235_1 /TAXON_ID=223996 /ORGANISM="Protocruzia adherens, Strain Boccale" /LENGTH=416 /DNA_ID=CAMNT_0002344491 /DNA_START=45 /DNA_END=1295 /DNA_ORIENTATION=+